jgi:hypothetical protein
LFLTSLALQQIGIARNERKFQGKVEGPFRAYITVADGKNEFAPNAQPYINLALDDYLVTNMVDFAVLKELCLQVDCHVDRLFVVENRERQSVPVPKRGTDTVASVFSISDDLVFNCLVDKYSIGTVVIIKHEEGGRVFFTEEIFMPGFSINASGDVTINAMPL